MLGVLLPLAVWHRLEVLARREYLAASAPAQPHVRVVTCSPTSSVPLLALLYLWAQALALVWEVTGRLLNSGVTVQRVLVVVAAAAAAVEATRLGGSFGAGACPSAAKGGAARGKGAKGQ